MRIPFFHVDAFASEVFKGNPAGVCLLGERLPDAVMQAIAAENNLPETAFVLQGEGRIGLRWFTPTVEVDLCGHATLAAAHVLFAHAGQLSGAHGARIEFQSKSGPLAVERDGELLVLDFPSRPAAACETPEALIRGLGSAPLEVLGSRDYLCVYEREEDVASLRPDMSLLAGLDRFGVIATAPSSGAVDFVSRFFAPGDGIPEDPVTGSAHCTLIPYWSGRLGRTRLTARQISARGGELSCSLVGNRVRIGGRAVTYLRGEIDV